MLIGMSLSTSGCFLVVLHLLMMHKDGDRDEPLATAVEHEAFPFSRPPSCTHRCRTRLTSRPDISFFVPPGASNIVPMQAQPCHAAEQFMSASLILFYIHSVPLGFRGKSSCSVTVRFRWVVVPLLLRCLLVQFWFSEAASTLRCKNLVARLSFFFLCPSAIWGAVVSRIRLCFNS